MNNATETYKTQENLENEFVKLSQLQLVCLKQNIPFVSYRLPYENEIITMVQQNSRPKTLDSLGSIDSEIGFVIAPFSTSGTEKTYLLSPDNILKSNEIEPTFIDELSKNKQFATLKKKQQTSIKSTTASEFSANVNFALETIAKGQLQKVVLSKVRVENIDDNFRPEWFFLDLCRKYPHAMVYIIQLPKLGCWIGATPEPLLEIENKSVKTISLAGTQVASEEAIDKYEWSSKEIEEQKIVTDSVEQSLRSLDVEKLTKVGPTNHQAANLIHLKTSFEFSTKYLENKMGAFIQALHPTPSVGGWPKKEAHNFITENEKHNRGYYSGFLGPVNINTKSNLFVNLRCLQLFDKQGVLYSGAGVTASSVAEKEWEETENKMMTMMNVIKKN